MNEFEKFENDRENWLLERREKKHENERSG